MTEEAPRHSCGEPLIGNWREVRVRVYLHGEVVAKAPVKRTWWCAQCHEQLLDAEVVKALEELLQAQKEERDVSLPLGALEGASGILNELTPEQAQAFDDAVRRR